MPRNVLGLITVAGTTLRRMSLKPLVATVELQVNALWRWLEVAGFEPACHGRSRYRFTGLDGSLVLPCCPASQDAPSNVYA